MASHIIDGFDMNDDNCAVTTFEPETPTHVLTSGTPGRGLERLTRVTTGGFRRHHYIVEVTGSSKEDIEANVAELISHLPMAGRGPLNLVRIASDGLTPVTDVAVAIEGMFNWPYTFRYDIGNIAEVEFTLVCTAYATLSPVSEGPTSLTTPCVVDLSAMTGEYDTPIDMLFSAPAANDLTELWVAYVPPEYAAWVDALSWIIEAESLIGSAPEAELVLDGSPTGADWPATWVRSDAGTLVHALASQFHVEDTGGDDSYMESATAMAVTAGVEYLAAVWLSADITYRDGAEFVARVDWYTAGDALISSSEIVSLSGADYADDHYSAQVTAPATATKAKMWGGWTGDNAAALAVAYGWTMRASSGMPSATWSHLATDALANPDAADNCVQTESTEGETIGTIDTAAFPSSPVEVLARAKQTTASLRLKQQAGDWVTVPGASWSWNDLGDVATPTRAVRGTETAPLVVSALPTAGTAGEGLIDRLATLPTRWGFWHWKAATGHKHTVERIGETLYVDDICDMAEVVGAAIEGLRGRLLIVAQGTSVTEATHAVDLTRTHTPRLTLW